MILYVMPLKFSLDNHYSISYGSKLGFNYFVLVFFPATY